jgi:two-component system, sensor histidine kinase YesM
VIGVKYISRLRTRIQQVLFKNLHIGMKLILAYIIVLAVPIILFAIYAFNNFAKVNQSEFLKAIEQDIRSERVNISRNVEICNRTAETVISYGEFLEFLSLEREPAAEELIDFNLGPLAYIQRIQYISPDVYRLRFFAGNRNISEIWPTLLSEARLKEEAWKEKLVSSRVKIHWQLNHLDNVTRGIMMPEATEVVSLFREVRYPGNEYLGIIEVNMLSEIFFRQMYSGLEDESSAYIVSRGDRLYYDVHNNYLKAKEVDEGAIKELLASNAVGEEGNFNIKINGAPAMVVYSYVQPIDAYLYKLVSLEGLIGSIDRVRNLIILTTLGLIVLLSAITYFITQAILRKLGIIIDSMRKVQEGEFNVDIPVRGNDELGELAHHFRKMLRKINDLISIIVRKQAANKDAEIRALQAQINAHFIYNVLETIKMMAEIEYKYEISRALTSLGRMMRYSMNWSRQFVTLREEITNIKNYIALLNIRFDNEIQLSIDIPEELLEHEMLKMALQPIVENAANHGIEPRGEGGTLWIGAYVTGKIMNLEIKDNGIGMGDAELESLREAIKLQEDAGDAPGVRRGIGLKNVNERIKLYYGNEYGIEIESKKDEFTSVVMKLPYLGSSGEEANCEKSFDS